MLYKVLPAYQANTKPTYEDAKWRYRFMRYFQHKYDMSKNTSAAL